MYCPVCFDQTLKIKTSGKAFLAINGKQSSTAMFLYNTEKQHNDEICKNLEAKIDEILKWYSGFENFKSVNRFEVFSNDFYCANKCRISASTRISLVSSLIERSTYLAIMERLAKKYSIQLDLAEESIAI